MQIENHDFGLFIFRGQPAIHLGHIAAVNELLESRAKRVLFVLGSTNVNDMDNPIPAEKRREMLALVCEEEKWGDKVLGIEFLPDTHDITWGQGILKILDWNHIKPVDIIARGNTDWTRNVLNSVGITTYIGEEEHRTDWQGNVIRSKMRSRDESYRNAFPQYMWGLLDDLAKMVIDSDNKNQYCQLENL